MRLKKSNIERSDVEEAMKQFLQHGGKIKTLPPQKVVTIYPVGSDAYSYSFGSGDRDNQVNWNYVEKRIASY